MIVLRSMRLLIVAVLSMSVLACASAPPPRDEAVEIEAFMWDYTRVWNTHDARQIAERFYRLGPSVDEQSANLERQFETLRAQGYRRSDIREIKGCLIGEGIARAGMKYSRLRGDGVPLPPADRASQYDLKRFPDGWRIVRIGGADPASPLTCSTG